MQDVPRHHCQSIRICYKSNFKSKMFNTHVPKTLSKILATMVAQVKSYLKLVWNWSTCSLVFFQKGFWIYVHMIFLSWKCFKNTSLNSGSYVMGHLYILKGSHTIHVMNESFDSKSRFNMEHCLAYYLDCFYCLIFSLSLTFRPVFAGRFHSGFKKLRFFKFLNFYPKVIPISFFIA